MHTYTVIQLYSYQVATIHIFNSQLKDAWIYGEILILSRRQTLAQESNNFSTCSFQMVTWSEHSLEKDLTQKCKKGILFAHLLECEIFFATFDKSFLTPFVFFLAVKKSENLLQKRSKRNRAATSNNCAARNAPLKSQNHELQRRQLLFCENLKLHCRVLCMQ